MQTIYLDISNKGVYPCIYAKQGDVNRKFLLAVTDGGVPFNCEETVISVWYDGDSGEGNYTHIGEESAISVTENKITVSLVQQMLVNAGNGILSISISNHDGGQIGLWNIDYCVEEKPGAESKEAKQYYDAFSKTAADLALAAKTFTPDKTLTKSGAPADASETGRQISVERARIDQLKTLQDGSTTGDAELADIRVGYDGNIYPTAGEAVRTQVGDIAKILEVPFHARGILTADNVQLKENIITNLSLKSGNKYNFTFKMSALSGSISGYGRLYDSSGTQLGATTLTNQLERVMTYTPSEDLEGAYVYIYYGGPVTLSVLCDVTIEGQKDKFAAINESLSNFDNRLNEVENRGENYASKDDARKQFIHSSPDDDICACARGSIMAKEIKDNFVANFSKEGDKKDHVATVAIVNDVAYMTYYSNMTNVAETPSEHIARFVYCPLSNPGDMTYIDLQTAGDTYDGMTVTGIYDTVMMRKDDNVLYLMWTASMNGVYHRLYRTFDIATGQLSDIYKNNFYVGEYGGIWNTTNMISALESAGIEHKPISIDIGLMQKLSTREENGETWYYSGAYANLFNCIVKSKDLVNWHYVSTPTFENDSQYENATYCIGNKVFYFVRQTEDNNTGFLTCYHIDTDTWEDPVFVADCQSRSDFIYTGGNLYLVHAPNNRYHISLLKIDQKHLNKSVEWQTGIVNSGIPYPFCIEYNNEIYVAYSIPYARITLSKFSIQNMENATIMEKLRTLVTG